MSNVILQPASFMICSFTLNQHCQSVHFFFSLDLSVDYIILMNASKESLTANVQKVSRLTPYESLP